MTAETNPLDIQEQPQANLMNYETFRELNESINAVVLNTASILEGYDKLDAKNITEHLEKIRSEALRIAGAPITQEKVQEIMTTIDTELNNALRRLEEIGGVDVNAIKQEITRDLEGIKTRIINDLNPIKERITRDLEGIKTTIINDLNPIKEEITQKFEDIKTKLDDKLNDDSNGFDYIALDNPKENTNPTKQNALWLNQKTSVIYTCIDNTENNNIWVGNGVFMGGIFSKFQPKNPDESISGNFYFNTYTQRPFIKHNNRWVEIQSIKVIENIRTIGALQEGVLYLQGKNFYYANANKPIYSVDYAQQGAPENNVNPTKKHAVFFNTRSKIFYICTDNKQGANVWDLMVSSKHSFNIITNPSTEIRADEQGFGGGLASDMALRRLGLEKLSGTEDRDSVEYANYVHTATGSIMHFTPAMYQKITFESGVPYYGIKIEYSTTKKEGYVLNRSFINGGQKIEGFFMDKFVNSIKDGKNVSVQNGIPLSLHSRYQPISQLGVSDNFGGCIDAARKRGGTFLMPLYMWRHYLNLMLAKYQASYMAGTCYDNIAWCSMIPHVVRGCNNGALSDHNDNSIRFTATGDGRGGKAGGVSTELDLKKISLFGDGASPCDFNGPMIMVTQGVNGNGNKLGILKNSVDIQGLTTANAHTIDFYDYFALPFSGAGYYGGGNEQCLCGAISEDTDEWRKDCLGIPKAQYSSSAEIFGGDSIALAAPNNCMPYVGAYWSATGAWGAFFAVLSTSASSNYYGLSHGYNYGLNGFRACAVGEVVR